MFSRALSAFLVLPGIAAILAPPLLARLDVWRGEPPWPWGLFLMAIGTIILLWCVRDFYVSGKGTLAPWDPPKSLVVIGLYRFVRNPMYVGVLILILGWGVYFRSPLLLAYCVMLGLGFHLRILRNEEPWLQSQFGKQWEGYRNGVSRWWPRITPWNKTDPI